MAHGFVVFLTVLAIFEPAVYQDLQSLFSDFVLYRSVQIPCNLFLGYLFHNRQYIVPFLRAIRVLTAPSWSYRLSITPDIEANG